MAARKHESITIGQQTNAGYTAGDFAIDAPDYVVVELRPESPVTVERRALSMAAPFAASAAGRTHATELNNVLSRYAVKEVRPHFNVSAQTLRQRPQIAAALPPEPRRTGFRQRELDAEFVKSNFVQVVPQQDGDAQAIAESLQGLPAVQQAFVAPRPVPAWPARLERAGGVATSESISGATAGSRNFEPAQGYLHAAPNGIGAMAVWDLDGARGQDVTICDIEGGWNLTHEDLPKGIRLLGGTALSDPGWVNHGTAVLGEMVSLSDARGTVGISHRAKAVVQSAFINGVFNLAGALDSATQALQAGDVILIELHAPGPTGKYVAMQYWDDVFSAIQVATAKGITVVEAAGNGDEDFDQPIFKGSGLQKDSGAIVVGAGVPPTNHIDFDGFPGVFTAYQTLGVPRSRLWFSNYGRIVNVQGWGWHVTTLGYGDLQGDPAQDRWYTLRFSGTSSASPIVTGAVACLQGRAKAKNGGPLTPSQVRQILIKTGTPQKRIPGGPRQKIGPLPNLVEAMNQV